jgi:hypothetical protein
VDTAAPTLMPAAGNCRALREAAVAGVPAAYRGAVTQVVNSWLAATAEATGTEHGVNPQVVDKDDALLAADRRAYREVTEALAADCTVLGRDPAEIGRTLARLLARVSGAGQLPAAV